jgi:hypothetical protein
MLLGCALCLKQTASFLLPMIVGNEISENCPNASIVAHYGSIRSMWPNNKDFAKKILIAHNYKRLRAKWLISCRA